MAIIAPLPCQYAQVYGDVEVEIQKADNRLLIKVETTRLVIESVNTEQHLLDLIDLYGDKNVNRLVGTGATLDANSTTAKVRRWISRWSENNPFSGYVVTERGSGRFVGQIILKPVKDKSDGTVRFVSGATEIGYLSKSEFWGRGYGKEYTHAMICHLVPELIRQGYQVKGSPIKYVMATTGIDNKASQHVLSTFMHHIETKPRYGSPREWYQHNFAE